MGRLRFDQDTAGAEPVVLPESTVYCDESRHTRGPGARFKAMGSLWLPSEARAVLSAALHDLRRGMGLMGEMKWTKVSARRLDDYRRVIDFFFERSELRFRGIIVDQQSVDLRTYHAGDAERAYNTFYYELLEKWIVPNRRFNVLLDYKPTTGSRTNHASILQERLRSHALHNRSEISAVRCIVSAPSHLAQLCDVLTGALAADANSDLALSSAKAALSAHVAQLRGTRSIGTATATSAPGKFNVFRIRLDGGSVGWRS